MRANRSGAGRWLAGALLALMLVAAPSAAAQSDVALNALTIEMWPEYDRATMLVILRGTLAPEVKLPASITLELPARTNGPFAVAAQQPDGSLVNAQFVTSAAGDKIAVTLQATAASFQVEYYDPAFTISGDQRTYSFDWTSPWRVVAASLRIQEPRDAGGLTAQPPVTLAGSSDLGLNYHTAALGVLEPNQVVHVELEYTKTTSALSVEELPQSAGVASTTDALPVSQPVAGLSLPTGPDAWQGWVAGALIAAAVGLGGWGGLIWWRGRSPVVPAAPRSRKPTTPRPAVVTPPARPEPDPAAPTKQSAQNFCTHCGRPVSAKDAFCRSCGTPVRARQKA